MKKLIILFALLVLTAFVVWAFINSKSGNKTPLDNDYIYKDSDMFSLKARYEKENKWLYTVTGTLPNPCYSASVDALVRESYPEQVSIEITVNKPGDEEVCAQVIKDFEYTGEFSASADASISLVEKN